MAKIRVLIVDDSVFMRQALVRILSNDNIEVIDIARNGREGVEKTISLKPDVVTMDIEMPVMNGIDALKEIMSTYPVPVIMVSTLTSEGADATLDALSNGAVDFITKRAGFREMDSLKDEVVSKVLALGLNPMLKNQMIRRRLQTRFASQNPAQTKISDIAKSNLPQNPTGFNKILNRKPGKIEIIGIGISTGGPNSLQEFVKGLPESFETPILIAQHMPAYFTKSLANRLNNLTNLTVKEAESDEIINKRTIYIAQGGKHLIAKKNLRIYLTDEPPGLLYKPSVDTLINSIADTYGSRALGIIMTGMGHDGLEGIGNIVRRGGYAIAQDPDSCVISGMPKSIIDANLQDEIQPLSNMAARVSEICK